MGKHAIARTTFVFVSVGLVLLLAAVSAGATPDVSGERHGRGALVQDRTEQAQERLCARIKALQERPRTPHIPLPSYCEPEEPGPNPEPPTVEISADPTAVTINGTTTLSWNSEHATECSASDGWNGARTLDGNEIVTINATTTYVIACANSVGTATSSVTVAAVPPPPEDDDGDEPPALPQVLISEVYYDVDTAAKGSDPANEWIELSNTTNGAVDLSGFTIGDAQSTDALPDGTIIPADGFLVIIASSTTAGFWSIPAETPIVNLGSSIGNGLANGGDAAFLRNNDVIIDSMSYGTNTAAFSPSVAAAQDGHSLARTSLAADSDTAADWTELDAPTPGTF